MSRGGYGCVGRGEEGDVARGKGVARAAWKGNCLLGLSITFRRLDESGGGGVEVHRGDCFNQDHFVPCTKLWRALWRPGS